MLENQNNENTDLNNESSENNNGISQENSDIKVENPEMEPADTETAEVSGTENIPSGQLPAAEETENAVSGQVSEPETENMDQEQAEGMEQEQAESPTMSYAQDGEPVGLHKLGRKHLKHMNAYVKALCCAIIFGLVAGGIMMGFMAAGNHMGASISTTTANLSTASSSTSSSTSSSSSSTTYSVSQIAKSCTSSVVAITNQSVSEVQSIFGGTQEQESESAGSGVIIGKNSTELLIVTNYHVIEGSDTLTVAFSTSKDAVCKAEVKGTDSDNDLAVIAVKLSDISDTVLKGVSVATIDSSGDSSVGDQVVAIGNALGSGQSITTGIISALNREVTVDDGTTEKLLQTDAAINPGNSGGALFNMQGELIAINTAKYSDTSVEGMGFAIPMTKAESIIKKLMNEETKQKLTSGYGYLGISGNDVDSTISEQYSVPEGVYVASVSSGSAADNAGIKTGDIITAFNGESVSSMSELKTDLQYYKAGTTVKVTIERSNGKNGYTKKVVSVTLDKAPTTSSSSSSSDSSSSSNGSTGSSGSDSGSSTSPYSFGSGSSGSSSGSSGSSSGSSIYGSGSN